ncbi:hypothetical protein MNBD_ALPHA11-588 [hydrothermal vent metagenome]|uniref:Uncharacterized protein n=1 Tax=hydrothermal vent metagenome TaxID=652676 RepID=A0A3B0UMZ0_9ZZZZ
MGLWGKIWLIDKVLPNQTLINGTIENQFAPARQNCGDRR